MSLSNKSICIALGKSLALKFPAGYRVVAVDSPNIDLIPLSRPWDQAVTVHFNEVKIVEGTVLDPQATALTASKYLKECRERLIANPECCPICHETGEMGPPGWIECKECLFWHHAVCVDCQALPSEDEMWLCPKCSQLADEPLAGERAAEYLSDPDWVPGDQE